MGQKRGKRQHMRDERETREREREAEIQRRSRSETTRWRDSERKKTQVDFKVVFHSQAKLLSQNGSRPTMIHGVVFGGVL